MTGGRPKRVCFPFVGDTIGGSHISALLLIDELDRTRFESVIALHEEGGFADYLAAREIPYVLVPRVSLVARGRIYVRFWGMLRCARRLAPFLRAQKIDIVHTNDVRMHLTWGLSARLAGAKFVWHQRTRLSLGKSAYFGLLANGLFVISEYCRKGYGRFLRQKAQIVLDPIGIALPPPDRSTARKAVLDELPAVGPIKSEGPVKIVAFVGNLREQKRPLDFIEAAGALKQRYGDGVRCLIFGEERMPVAERARIRISELGLEGICFLMGPRFPIEPWLAGCDLVLLPAVREGFGRVLIEAMLVGTPVIASRDGGHVEVIEDGVTGILVPPGDPSSLAVAAIGLLDDPQRAAAIAKAALQPAKERYTPRRHAETVQSYYRGFFGKTSVSGAVSNSRREFDFETDIIFIIHDMRGGGAQRVALTLIDEWIRQGRKVHVITWLAPETDFFVLPDAVRRTVIGKRPQNSGRLAAHLSNVRAISRIRRSLRRDNPKAVVSFITVTNIFVILAAFGLKNRLLISERNDPTRQIAGPVWGALRWFLYRFADVVTANTTHAVEAMTGYVPTRKLAVVANPVVLAPPVAPGDRSAVILSVGRLVPQKNQRLIIAALSSLKTRAGDWRVEILGEGPERVALTALAESSGIADRVALPGTVPDPSPHYRAAGIFVLSSVYEGTPNVLLEAMAHGLPCIVSDSLPGALEYVEDRVSGLIFQSGDASHLAECLAALIEDPDLRRRLGDEARKRMEGYSVEKVSAQWDALLFP